MSRNLLRVSVFLLALSLALASTRGNCGEPPKKAPPDAGDDPFGDGLPRRPAKRIDTRDKAPTAPAKVAQPAPSSAAKAKPSSNLKLHGGEKAILKALKKKASVDFNETPLKDVANFLSVKYRIPIRLDPSGLKDAGVDEATPVNCKLSGISLQSALEIILEELQLEWTIHHEVLTITSPTKAESDEYMCTKTYDVRDLVAQPADDFVLRDNPLSTPSATAFNALTFPNSPLSGSFSGGGLHYADRAPRTVGDSKRDLSKELSEAIKSNVRSKWWLENGGIGTITIFNDWTFTITQSREVHSEIERFLANLRAERRAVPTLTVELHWLWLDAKARDELFARGAKHPKRNDVQTIDPQWLREMVRKVPCFHAQATCMNGLGTSLAAGDRRALLTAAIPVLDGGIAYTPVTTFPNVGLTAEFRPTAIPSTNSATLYVHSTITRWTPVRPPANLGAAWPAAKYFNLDATQPAINGSVSGIPAVGTPASGAPQDPPTNSVSASQATSRASISAHGSGSASCPIDLPVMPTQDFGTTLTVPLGKPVVVGSVTFAPAGDACLGAAKENPVEVYLIATTSIIKKAAKK